MPIDFHKKERQTERFAMVSLFRMQTFISIAKKKKASDKETLERLCLEKTNR